MISMDEAVARIAERTIENTQQLKRSKQQRRVSFTDNYGIEYLRTGTAGNPATFYVSISPDFEYYERFGFKFQIMPFVSTVTGIDGGSISIGSTSLSANMGSEVTDGTSTLDMSGSGITPNPHTHQTSGSLGGLTYGVHTIHTTSDNWTVSIHGIDITDYLIEQHDGDWITKEDIYPTNRLDGVEDFYDILDVASVMYEEGRTDDAKKILVPELKKVEIASDAPFSVAAMVYMKHSNMNR